MKVHSCAAAAMLAAAIVPGITSAQSTLGFGATVIIPVVAATQSYASEVWVQAGFNNPSPTIDINVTFYAGKESNLPGAHTCTPISVNSGAAVSFSLATQCGLTISPTSKYFGMVVLEDADTEKLHQFAAYSRVQNPQAIGFSVEGFPIGSLSPQSQNVTGLKRVGAPAPIQFQTNCFVGALGQQVDYRIRLFNATNTAKLGTTLTGTLLPWEMTRILDIFGAAGLSGDWTNVSAVIDLTTPFGPSPPFVRPMWLSFCTVQDNTSFGADFRMGKSFDAWDRTHKGGQWGCTPASCGSYDQAITDATMMNGYALYIRPPDNVKCELVSDRLDELEMRLGKSTDPPWPTLAGGDNQTSFYYSTGPVVVDPATGDTLRTFYPLLVSARETVPAPVTPIPFTINCFSGNGIMYLELPFSFPDDF